MSSAILWVLFPLAVGLSLLAQRRSTNSILIVAFATSLFLAWAAWQIPIDSVLQLGPVSFEIFPSMSFFGRSLVLGQAERPLLTMLYFWESIWLLGALLAKPRRLFAPLTLAAVALFVAAISVEPFLYAALILAAVVLLLIPLLAPPGTAPGRGVLRFLKFQIFAVPFILFTGWLLTGIESTPGDTGLVLRVGVLLALGFGFLMAVFPFHSWLPMLAEETSPYVVGFLSFFLPVIASIFILNFFDRYVWLRSNVSAYGLLLMAGSVNVVVGGLWAAGQRNLGRVYGFAAMMAIGSELQAIGLGGATAISSFFALMLPLAAALWLATLALSVFSKEAGTLELNELQSSFCKHPSLTIGLVASLCSIAGLPLLGPFFAHLSIWDGLALYSPWILAVSLIGSLGLLIAAIRLLNIWLGSQLPAVKTTERKDALSKTIEPLADFANPLTLALVSLGMLTLIGFGLVPQIFQGYIAQLGAHFPQLFP